MKYRMMIDIEDNVELGEAETFVVSVGVGSTVIKVEGEGTVDVTLIPVPERRFPNEAGEHG